MTKLLSELLDAKEPDFRHTINRLEKANANPAQDIRLSQQIKELSRQKLLELGLDPNDTTGAELYHVLQQKLKEDDKTLIKHLRALSARHVSAAANLSDGLAWSLKDATKGNQAYGLKMSVAKRLLSKNPPKRTMKVLGYRSNTSLLKHEPLGLVVIVASQIETLSWRRQYYSSLKNLTPNDCESRSISVVCPSSSRWQDVLKRLSREAKQTIWINNELATVGVLPLSTNQPAAGITTATLAFGVEALNSIYATSSYLRLSQVTKEFGQRLEYAASQEPGLSVSLLETPLSWEALQRFVYRMSNSFESLLETPLDFSSVLGWQPLENLMHKLAPHLEFWKDVGHVSLLDGHTAVSFNILDNALNLANHKSYPNHFSHHAKRALWQELMLKYMQPELLKEALERELQPKLAAELVDA